MKHEKNNTNTANEGAALSDSLDGLVRCVSELQRWDLYHGMIPKVDGDYVKFHDVINVVSRNVEKTTENPWCDECEEDHCLVSGDGTCSMIRRYKTALSNDHDQRRINGEKSDEEK